MADHEEHTTAVVVDETAVEVETKNRGLFDCFGKKKNKEVEDDKVIMTEFEEKVQVSETKQEQDEDDHGKKHGLLEKLHRSDSSSSSSGDEGVENEKKKKQEKEEVVDTSTTMVMEGCEVEEKPEEKKGLMEKMKQKLPGGHKKTEQEQNEAPSASTTEEKKGFLEKIKEKLPGFHSKEEKEKEKEDKKGKEHGSC